MFGTSIAWNGSGQKCSICGGKGEMQIDVVDEEGYEITAVFCIGCLRDIVRCEFSELEDKTRMVVIVYDVESESLRDISFWEKHREDLNQAETEFFLGVVL
jgi:polyferredoxin